MALELKVNGTVSKASSTRTLIFGWRRSVAIARSSYPAARRCDHHRTPGGVGVARKPQDFPARSDTVQLKIPPGEQTQGVNVAFCERLRKDSWYVGAGR